jgi:hypothetical protein
MYINHHIILYWVELGSMLLLATYCNEYYAYTHNDRIIIVILQAVISHNLLILSAQSHVPNLVHRLNEKGMAIELKTQHRMQPQVAKLIMSTLYPGLESHSSVTNMCTVKGVHQNMFFVSHEHLADKVHACIVDLLHTPCIMQIMSLSV